MQSPSPNEISNLQDDEMVNLLQERISSGAPFGDAMNMTERHRDALYQVGHGFYSQARYSDAFNIFSMLVIFDHLNARNLMALASTAQMLGRYEDALQHYSTAALALANDPRPMIHSADCLVALGHTDLARESLDLALELSDGNPQHAALKVRAEIMLSTLSAKGRTAISGSRH